uniref:Replication-associated protein n=1 Tax=Genomoviridae sp. TaxID=2202565 RepID=A0A858NFW5_9VIRU|nr:MAG: replication-associated protein [Genomoviridae sp.]
MAQFHIYARYWFLTYAQCEVDPEVVRDFIFHDVSPAKPPKFVLVSRELHESGDLHLHAFIDWGGPKRTRNARYLDLATGHHPRIESPRNRGAALNYVKKDGDYCWAGEEPDFGQTPSQADERDTLFDEFISESHNANEFLSTVRAGAPYTYATSYPSLKRMATDHWDHAVEDDPVEERPFNVPDEVQKWLDEEFSQEVSLLLIGDYSCGKTSWARSLGNHIFFRNMYDLDEWRPDADYVVFDDIPLKHVHAAKMWLSAQGVFTDTDKYRKKRRISWGPKKCCIVLCNRGRASDWRFSEEWQNDSEWFLDACTVVELHRGQKMY